MDNKDKLGQYCIELIRAVMAGDTVPQLPEGIQLSEMFSFSKMHGLEAIVCYGLNELGMNENDPVWIKWCQRADMLLTQSIVQLAERDILFEVMDKAGISLLPVKGSWLKEAYPQIDFRQMADLDMLIHGEDREKAKQVMLQLGYMEEPEHAFHHDSFTKQPYTSVELHFQLLPSNSEFYNYFADIWKKAKPVEAHCNLYRLSAEDEYIFYFVHLKKHMDGSGCGIRFILDCAVFRRTYQNMDRLYLQQEFETLGIYGFVQSVELLADCWFVSGTPLPASLQKMAENILRAGTYGTIEQFFWTQLNMLREKHKNPVLLIAAYWLNRIFRPLWFMKHYYPVLEKYPVLLPFTWVLRLVKKCVSKPAELLYQIKQIYKEGTKND